MFSNDVNNCNNFHPEFQRCLFIDTASALGDTASKTLPQNASRILHREREKKKYLEK
jgi:hypothetical protein